MVEQSRSEPVSVRFGPYIEELREFFSRRGVPFGSPEDVVGFAERVAMPGSFEEEMGSMVRSIFFREGETLGRGELLALVAVAVGGAEVEAAAQQMHASVRQVLVFVNGALRQHQRTDPGELGATSGEGLTAGNILASAQPEGRSESRAMAGRSPENGFYAGADAGSAQTPTAQPRRDIPGGGGGMLFKAVTMSESESQSESQAERRADTTSTWPGAGRPWLIPALVAIVVIVGLGAYFLAPGVTHHTPLPTTAGSGPAALPGAGSAASGCVSPMAAGASRAGLEERSRWAHNLLDQKMYEAALPELRDIARVDPGFPGINLDEADALLQMKRPQDAREAVDTQIGISECLARLPGAALDAYCSAEFSASTVGSCRPHLAHIQQSAELQAAMVHLELGHRIAPESPAAEAPVTADLSKGAAAAATPTRSGATASAAPIHLRHTPPPLPPATEGDADQPSPARVASSSRPPTSTRPAARKHNADDSLVHGEGTDSAFGAYAKPQ